MSSIARLKVVLDGVEPRVVRRFEAPVTMRLSRLHTVLQIMMGWTDTHRKRCAQATAVQGMSSPTALAG